MKYERCDIIYFVFLWFLYIFLQTYSQEAAFEIISHSYMLFLQLIIRFSQVMAMRGWRRLF